MSQLLDSQLPELKHRLKETATRSFANDNISDVIYPEDMDVMQAEAEEKIRELMQILSIDVDNCHNSHGTPRRIAKMLIHETMRGRYYPRPEITTFPNLEKYDQMYTVGPIPVVSLCAHHWQNFIGECYIGVFPGDQFVGLSKFNRIVDWHARRPQIQEELTKRIADEIQQLTKAEGLGVIIRATHQCVTCRGVNAPHSNMVTSDMRGKFHDAVFKNEFFSLIKLKDSNEV